MGNYKLVLEKVNYEWVYPTVGQVYKLYTDEEGVVFILISEEVETVTSEDGEIVEQNVVVVLLQEFDTEEEPFKITLEDFIDMYVELDPEDIMDGDELKDFLSLNAEVQASLEDILEFDDEDVPLYLNILTEDVYEVKEHNEYIGGDILPHYILLNLSTDVQERVSLKYFEKFFILIEEDIEEEAEDIEAGEETTPSLTSWGDQDEIIKNLDNTKRIEEVKAKLTEATYLMLLLIDKMDSDSLEALDKELTLQLERFEELNVEQE